MVENWNANEYVTICAEWSKEDPPFQWLALADGLRPRKDRGWRFEVDNDGEPMWLYGIGGTGRLVALVEQDGRIRLFDYDADATVHFDEVNDLLLVIDPYERRNRNVTDMIKSFIEYDVGSSATLKDLQEELFRQDQALDGP
jgi:hypothetical protein